jgi:hypothetical protein
MIIVSVQNLLFKAGSRTETMILTYRDGSRS